MHLQYLSGEKIRLQNSGCQTGSISEKRRSYKKRRREKSYRD